ncbi:MAG: hypothetical protein GY821_11890, partial [Gammaproteobacteria bacterium]|nr:hypothetical protein [Gammaproteobacteria bacterium]
MIDHINTSVNLVEDGFDDEEVAAFANAASTPDPTIPPCPSCVTITQAALSSNPQDLIDHINTSVNLAEDGFEDEEVAAFANTSDEEEIENNPSQNAPKMDAEAIKGLLKELREDMSAQNKQTAENLVAQMSTKLTEQSKQFNDALNEVQENVEQVRCVAIGNERPGDWGDEHELQQNPITTAENQSSR